MDEPTSPAQVKQSPHSPSSSWGGVAPDPARANLPLTAKQKAIWDLKRAIDEGGQGKKNAEIAAIMGISVPVVSKTLGVIYKKLGISPGAGRRVRAGNLTEHQNPQKAAAVMDAISEPPQLVKLVDSMREVGVPARAAEALIKRLRVKYYGAITAVRNLKTQEILDMLGEKIHLALTYMDDKVMSEASYRDLALGTAAMIEKRQLLRGEPTQIISDAERGKLHELMPLLIQEAKRRGLTVEGEVLSKETTPA